MNNHGKFISFTFKLNIHKNLTYLNYISLKMFLIHLIHHTKGSVYMLSESRTHNTQSDIKWNV